MLETLCKLIEDHYIIVERVEEITQSLRTKAYADLTPEKWADTLTAHLRGFDRHFKIQHNPEQAKKLHETSNTAESDEVFYEIWLREGQEANFGFRSVSILEGNIACIEMSGFAMPIFGAETAGAVMQFVQNARALIFDLRQNRGGSPEMVQFLITYLFEGEPRHLNTFNWRDNDQTQQFWTLPYVPGRRLPDLPVYILTSRRTASAGEEFSYNLKHMGRATLIGETTCGAAHPVSTVLLGDEFLMSMPTGRPINPITKTNWEQVGVTPHIEVPAEEALDVALAQAKG